LRKRIALLGSTGSIGRQALEVIDHHPGKFEVEVLSANRNHELLISQAKYFKPNAVVISRKEHYQPVAEALQPLNIKVFTGEESNNQVVEMDSIDTVLIALVGFAGLMPTINAIKAKKQIALANKESLVVAGEIVTALAQEHHTSIIPVDSEHSAIFQCLAGENPDNIEKIILTASGGPFRKHSFSQLKNIKKEDALNHPNWNMGDKITIDSATLMNKGLEVIEARWLFGLDREQIEIVIHPQSIIHSLVCFCDGSVKAQLSLPDMRLPIQFALSFPHRIENDFPKFTFNNNSDLTFEKPDLKKFRNLALAFSALEKGGNMPCVLNAANEVVVEAFLKNRVGFLSMSDIIEKCMEKAVYIAHPAIGDYLECDKETRLIAEGLINARGSG
jgi:1-deoxy-D-xylulose-5-phosphate reductoisomerase